MKFEYYAEEWAKDSVIDVTELGNEALNIPKLHHKYYQFFYNEKLILKKRESELKQLKLEKQEFYSQGHNEETKAKGWVLPAKGNLMLKSDIPVYMEADKDIIELSLKIGAQQEKVSYLASILDMIKYRNNTITNAIEWQKFISGG